MSTEKIRNIAIIAHVDHGKTTLVDELLKQSGTLGERADDPNRMMDSNDLEKERGITILSKNTSIDWEGYKINIVDTPGHADFGGEVERVLSMVDSVLLLVDAVDGPMPQTRFVTQKAFEMGFTPVVVVNKVDRPSARTEWVVDQTFDLFDQLGATDEQLDFPVIYASAINGYASEDETSREGDMQPLFQAIVDKVSPPDVDVNAPFQMQVSTLDYNSFLGLIGIGRIKKGTIKANSPVSVIDAEGKTRNGRILKLFGFKGLDRIEVKEAEAGDIVAISGIDGVGISDTLCDRDNVEALPPLTVDEPTISMMFCVNDSPFAGKSGKFLTSRQIRDRLDRETTYNVALRVEDTESSDQFKVSGRGELHLSVLIETMRREGFELAISRPQVIYREVDGEIQEPYEEVVVDIEAEHQGAIMEQLLGRRAEVKDIAPDSTGRVRMNFIMPARGLIGYQSEFKTTTSGGGILTHVFDHYGRKLNTIERNRKNGVLISNGKGKALGFALWNLQERGRLLIEANVDVYEGQVVGIHSRDNDLTVNPLKGKQLTNVRASGKDDAINLVTPIKMTLEQSMEFIEDDELVEVTPDEIRIRKRHLLEHERKRASREA
ncbi:translational GTPase TypA [Marinicella rhabdoformis]|uniref:translational GTPase TypA n=1 Tax=Marinicella rhabdoformis TaxID=2580566 RepID=UPI0012AEDC80|nr:translational GTPase TypA [Marinicella rhabdoformis]